MLVRVHCFRCDDVVDVELVDPNVPLWCVRCEDTVLAPPTVDGDGRVWWSADGLELDAPGTLTEEPDDRRRHRSTGSSVVGAAMLGLERAIFGPVNDETPIVHVDDEPDRDEDTELHLDEAAPARSWIRFRRRP